jgi:hypothetical protein
MQGRSTQVGHSFTYFPKSGPHSVKNYGKNGKNVSQKYFLAACEPWLAGWAPLFHAFALSLFSTLDRIKNLTVV